MNHPKHRRRTLETITNNAEQDTQNRRDYSREVLQAFIDEYKSHTLGVRFYNRGIPDGYGWDRFFGLELEPYAELEDANQRYRYDALLILDPPDTFEDENDVVWAQDREIRRVHELIVRGYSDVGYSPIFVPADAAGERLDFICACPARAGRNSDAHHPPHATAGAFTQQRAGQRAAADHRHDPAESRREPS